MARRRAGPRPLTLESLLGWARTSAWAWAARRWPVEAHELFEQLVAEHGDELRLATVTSALDRLARAHGWKHVSLDGGGRQWMTAQAWRAYRERFPGYLRSSELHRAARAKVSARRRREIARLGGRARAQARK